MNIVNQITDIEKGRKNNTISVGNLNAVRDYTDRRSVMDAYTVNLY